MADEGLITTEAPVEAGGFEDSSFEEPTETSTEATETAETEQPSGLPAEPKLDTPPANLRPVVDGKLSPEFKPFYDKLKAEQPALARAVMNAIQSEARFLKEVPGGLKEVQQLREHIERLGGEDGIQEITGELAAWKEFDEQYTAGDPKVLEFLTETPEASAAFLKIAPAAFEKFREVHPEGYASYVSQVFLGDMNQSKIPEQLIELRYIIGGMPEGDLKASAAAALGKLNGYVDRINGIASKQVAPPKTQAPGADDKRATELTQRETNLRRTEWRGDTDRTHKELFEAEWKKQIGERKLTADQRTTIQELYGVRMSALTNNQSNPEFNKKLNQYFAGNNRDGFVKFHRAEYARHVPAALRAAIQRTLGSKTPTPGTQQRPGAPPPQKPAAGFTFVNAKPGMDVVNRSSTTPDMWLKRQAILKDGRRVTWR